RPALMHDELVFGVDEGLARARRIKAGSDRPVVLLEHADRFGDSTYVLRAVVESRLGRAAVPFLWDPDAVASGMAAGVGARVQLPLGGHSSERAGGPVTVQGKVLFAGPKSYQTTGAMGTGSWVDLGDVVVL